MYDEAHFTRDAAHVDFDESADGITVDDDGEPEFDWDDVETVTVENPPHANAFDSKEFYKIPATVAKPIPQPYQYGEDTVWLKKPREELKKAAWSLDNAPWTLGHPETGMVKSVDDVHGFWSDPRYIDEMDDLDADLHIPVHDEDAKDFLEDNSDVSVGFYNRVARTDDYDGVVGGIDDGDVDVEGYQTDMLFDHCASVKVGRCPSGAGCGIDSAARGREHGHVSVVDSDAFKRGTRITDSSDDADGTETDSMPEDGECDCGCQGGSGGDADDDNTDTDMGIEIDIDDLSAEAALEKMAAQHDGVEEHLEDLREQTDAAEYAEEAAEELELDDTSDLVDTVAMLQEQRDNLKEEVEELQRPQMEEDAEFIAEHTDRFGEDADEVIENLDEDPDAVSEKRDLVEDLAEEYDEATANSGGGDDESPSSTTTTDGYAKSPWE